MRRSGRAESRAGHATATAATTAVEPPISRSGWLGRGPACRGGFGTHTAGSSTGAGHRRTDGGVTAGGSILAAAAAIATQGSTQNERLSHLCATDARKLFDDDAGPAGPPLTKYSCGPCHSRAAAAAAHRAWGGPWQHEPQSLTEALKTPWAGQWQDSAGRELQNHVAYGAHKPHPSTGAPRRGGARLLPGPVQSGVGPCTYHKFTMRYKHIRNGIDGYSAGPGPKPGPRRGLPQPHRHHRHHPRAPRPGAWPAPGAGLPVCWCPSARCSKWQKRQTSRSTAGTPALQHWSTALQCPYVYFSAGHLASRSVDVTVGHVKQPLASTRTGPSSGLIAHHDNGTEFFGAHADWARRHGVQIHRSTAGKHNTGGSRPPSPSCLMTPTRLIMSCRAPPDGRSSSGPLPQP